MFIPGVGGYGVIARTDVGHPRYFGDDYTSEERRQEGIADPADGGLSGLGSGYSPFTYFGGGFDATGGRRIPGRGPALSQLQALRRIWQRGR